MPRSEKPILFSGEIVRAILAGTKRHRKLYPPPGVSPTDRTHLARRILNGIDHINGDGCWIWGRTTSAGYGSLTVARHTVRAHRLAYALHHGLNERGLREIMHSCDKPRCVNPDHLSEGTHGDNVRDAVRKGRAKPPQSPCARGEDNPAAKLTWDAAQMIRTLHAAGETQESIATRFGVSQTTVSLICRRKRWADA